MFDIPEVLEFLVIRLLRLFIFTEAHQPLTEAGAKDRLDQFGVRVGPKTTRNRILQLLDKHVMRKRLRTEDQPKNKRHSESAHETIQHNIPEVQDRGVRASNLDYSQLQDYQLVQLLRMVGVDAERFDRKSLIHQCEAYSELREYNCSSLLFQCYKLNPFLTQNSHCPGFLRCQRYGNEQFRCFQPCAFAGSGDQFSTFQIHSRRPHSINRTALIFPFIRSIWIFQRHKINRLDCG